MAFSMFMMSLYAIGNGLGGRVALSYIGIGVLLFGIVFLSSWVGSFFMYGFGELIDKTCEIERNTRRKADAPKTSPQGNWDFLKQINPALDKRTETLEKLYSKGVITEEEFQQATSQEQQEV